MNSDQNDRDLRQLFQDLKSRDSQRVPPFDALARTPNSAAVRWRVTWRRFRFAAAAVLLLVATLVFVMRPDSLEAEMQQWAMLSQWTASTDALLDVSSTPWGSTVTTPSDSWLNTIDISPDTPKEDL
jgi:hypothetical protein